MNSNNPREQRAYQRRLKRLQARDRRWRSDQEPYTVVWNRGVPYVRHGLDGDLRPAPGRRNREIDDGGLD